MNSPDSPAPFDATRQRAVADLRAQFLDHLAGDVLPMAHFNALITDSDLVPTVADRHTLALDLITELLRENLILVGGVVGGDPAYIQPWTGSHADILNRIRGLYVDNYDNTYVWDLTIWFSLNDPQRIWHDNESDT